MQNFNSQISGGKGAALLMAVVVFAYAHCGYCADVVVDQYQAFQTIVGWGHGGGFYNGITGIAGDMRVAWWIRP